MATPTSGVDRWLTLRWITNAPGIAPGPRRPIIFQEHTENEALQVNEYNYFLIEVTRQAPRGVSIWIDGQRLETSVYGIWEWKTVDYAGLYHFEIQTGTGERHSTWIRVFPRKMRIPAYEKMKQELSQIALDLLLRVDSPAREKAEYITSREDTSALHDYLLISQMIDELGNVLSQIRRSPLHTLRPQNVSRNWQQMTRFSSEVMPLPGNHQAAPAVLEKQQVRYLPATWMTQERHLTYDTYENRLLKHFLQTQLVAKLSQIEKKGRDEEKLLAAHCKRYSTDDDAKDQLDKIRLAMVKCQQMKECCLRWSNEPFLQEVRPLVHGGHATQILLKNPTYNRFYRLYLRFQQHLKITRDAQKAVEELSLRKVSSLYELWSIFQISKMVIEEFLEAGYRMISNTTFFELEKDYFQFDVRKNVSSIVLARGDLEVRLKYEPLYPNHNLMLKQSALVAAIRGANPLKPDLAVEVYQGGQPYDLLIFDAKYKRAKEHGRTVPTQDDIDTMYKYHASILWQTYKEGAHHPYKQEQIVSYACILYPGNELHREGINLCVRALPLVPDLSLSLRQEIRQTFKELLHRYI